MIPSGSLLKIILPNNFILGDSTAIFVNDQKVDSQINSTFDMIAMTLAYDT